MLQPVLTKNPRDRRCGGYSARGYDSEHSFQMLEGSNEGRKREQIGGRRRINCVSDNVLAE